MISIPMRHGGDSKPTMTMKQARPRASPHWRSRCWVFPAIWSGLPCAPCTVPSNCFKRHQTENLRQVTDAPVSTRPRTGMPSRVSWPVMDGPTAHPTGVTLALGDPPRNLNAPGGALAAFCRRKLENLASWWAMRGFPGLLEQQALQKGASGAAIGEVTLLIA